MDSENALSDERREAVETSFLRQDFLTRLGARIVDLAPGRCTIELPFSASVVQQHGFFHGGAIGALADSAGGYAAMTTAPSDTDVLTLEYKINFLRPATGDALVAVGEVLRAGRSSTITRVDVFARRGDDRLLCAAAQQSVAMASQQPAPR